MDQFNPCLRNFVAMGKNYEKALASKSFFFFFFSLSLIYFLCAFHCRFRHSAKAALSLYFPLTIATYLSLLSKKKKAKRDDIYPFAKGARSYRAVHSL